MTQHTPLGTASTDPDPTAAAARTGRRRMPVGPAGTDVLACLAYLAAAVLVLSRLWVDPTGRILSLNPEDQILYEWFLANDTLLWSGDSGLLSDRLNHPEGVNLLANTTVIALGLVATPVTLAWGAPVTFALFATLNLAGTAFAWYLLLARGLRLHRVAAAVAGAFCGFAPGMISQNISHLHMSAQWLVPAMVWCVIRLAGGGDPATPRRDRSFWAASLGLAALVVLQVFVGEEVLFLTAFAMLLFVAAYALTRRPAARALAPRFLAGLGVTAAAAGAVLAYPLWFQFFGPQGVKDGIFSPAHFSADLTSWVMFSPLSLAGSPAAASLTTGPSEYNTFLGLPLLVVAVACAVWLIRRPVVAACVAAALGMAVLSLGPQVVVSGERTPVPAPYWLLQNVPLVDGALPMRFALAAIPLLAVVLALAMDRSLRCGDRLLRWSVTPAVVAALVPLAPLPVPVAARAPLPEFITGGGWRQCVPEGGVLVPVPAATPPRPQPMRWPTATDVAFAIPEGFFIGPYGADGTGAMGVSRFPVSLMLEQVADTGRVPALGPPERAGMRAALAFWRADCVAVADSAPHAPALTAALADLLERPGVRIADATTWKITR